MSNVSIRKEGLLNINEIMFTYSTIEMDNYINVHLYLKNYRVTGFRIWENKVVSPVEFIFNKNIKEKLLINIYPERNNKTNEFSKNISIIERAIYASKIKQLTEQEIREKILDAINLIDNKIVNL